MKHYNSKYFAWQKSMGKFGGKANLFKFEKFIKETDTVVDFGSGGGYLLNNLNCERKIGIDINEVARAEGKRMGIEMVESAEICEDNIADVIISESALEHVESPYIELCKLKKILKNNGKIIFVVPWEKSQTKYVKDDINMHLYTWNPQNLYNLFKFAGYKVEKIDIIRHTWPPYYEKVYKYFGKDMFDLISKIYSRINKTYQLRIVCKK